MSWGGKNPRILSSSMGEEHQQSREGPWGFHRPPLFLPHASWLEQDEAQSTPCRTAGRAGPVHTAALCSWAVGCGLVRLTSAPRELSGSSPARMESD